MNRDCNNFNGQHEGKEKEWQYLVIKEIQLQSRRNDCIDQLE
jgi:hypothetical protein